MQSNKRAKTKITVAWKTGLIPKVSSALVSKATHPALRGTSWGLITTGFKAYLMALADNKLSLRGQQQAWWDGVWEGPAGSSYVKAEQHSEVTGGSLGPHWPEQNSGASRLTWAHMFRTNNQGGQVRENYSKEEGWTEWQFRNSTKQQPQWEMVAVSTKPLSEHEVQSCFGKTYCTQE